MADLENRQSSTTAPSSKSSSRRSSVKISPVSPIRTTNLSGTVAGPSSRNTTTESTNILQIVYARYNVFMRRDETDETIVRGFLCLTMSADLTGFEFVWISKASLGTRSASLLHELVIQTQCFDFWTGHPMPPAAIEVESVDMLTVQLVDVAKMTIEPRFTLYHGEEACLPVITVHINIGDDQFASWPSLWVGPLQDVTEEGDTTSPGLDLSELMRRSFSSRSASEKEEEVDLFAQPTYEDVLFELRTWFRTIHFDLLLSEEQNVHQLVREVKPDPLMDELGKKSRFRNKWPDNLPRPSEDSTLYKLGAFGMGMMKTIVGKPIGNKIEDVGWGVLDRFSRVTHFARDKTTKVLSHPVARPIIPLIPETIRDVAIDSEEADRLVQEYDSAGHFLNRFSNEIQQRIQHRLSIVRQVSSTNSDAIPETPWLQSGPDAPATTDLSCEFDNLKRQYRSHVTRVPIKAEEWIGWSNSEGQLIAAPDLIKCHIFCKGLHEDIRVQAWKFILGSQAWESKDSDRIAKYHQLERQYLEMKQTWLNVLFDTEEDSHESRTHTENATVGDENEELDVISKFKERKHRIEKDVVRTDPTIAFFDMSKQAERVAESNSKDGGPTTPGTDLSFNVESNTQLVLLRNVLMTYTVYAFDLGYVQGMSDLAAPVIATIKDEVESFWCFVGFMERMKPNFYRDQSGMKTQLRKLELLLKIIDPYLYDHFESCDSSNMFCCFRWMLILFKREFSFYDSCALWEAIWTCPLTSEFHLFVAIAILNKHRQSLFRATRFDQILKFVNNLSEHLALDDILQRAEILFYVFYDRFLEVAPESMGGKEGMRQSTDLTPILELLKTVSSNPAQTGRRLQETPHGQEPAASLIPISTSPDTTTATSTSSALSGLGRTLTSTPLSMDVPKSRPESPHRPVTSLAQFTLTESEWLELVSVLQRPGKE